MKKVLLFSMLFCAIALPVFGETSEDTVKTDIAVIKTEIKNLNEKIDDKFEDINGKFESIEKNFDRQNNILIACIGIPLAILAIGATVWGILANRRSPKINEQQLQLQIEELRKQQQQTEELREELRREIEELRQQPVFSTGPEL